MKRLIALALLIIALAVIMSPALAAPLMTKHPLIASIALRQNTNEAQVTLSAVDLGPSKKYSARAFRKGVIIADDAGRMVAIRGEAVRTGQARAFQVFMFANMYIDLPGLKVIRVTHISLLVFTGDDWDHPYETGVCSSPDLSIDECLSQWHP